MIKQSDVKPGDIVYYHVLQWEEPERGVVSSLCPDPDFIFVKYTDWDTAARTSRFYLFKEKPVRRDHEMFVDEGIKVPKATQLQIWKVKIESQDD